MYRGGFEPPRLDFESSLADMHQAVFEFDHGTWRAADRIAGCVVRPSAVAVPGAARIIGAHCVVRSGGDGRVCGIVTDVSCAGSPNCIIVVRAACVVSRTAIVSRTGADDGRSADRRAPILPARDAGNANGRKRATDPCLSALDR